MRFKYSHAIESSEHFERISPRSTKQCFKGQMENVTKESEVLYDIFKLISDRNESQKRQVSKVKNILVKKQHVNLEM